jgi:predicted GIY-YIG superfamily endonuclease
MNTSIVYKVTSPSGRVYIGITKRSLQHRLACHDWETRRGSNYKFHKAIRKHGWNKLNIVILKSNLSESLSKKFDSYKTGYNSTIGGEGANGTKHSLERVEANRQRQIERFKNPEQRENASDAVIKYFKNNVKARKNLSDKFKERIKSNPEEHKRIRDKANLKIRSRENRLNNSIKSGGKPFLVFKKDTGEFIGRYEIIMDVNREFNINNGKVTMCLRGQRNHAKGYVFKYE